MFKVKNSYAYRVKKYGQTVTSDTVVEALHPFVQDALEGHALKIAVDNVIETLSEGKQVVVCGSSGL